MTYFGPHAGFWNRFYKRHFKNKYHDAPWSGPKGELVPGNLTDTSHDSFRKFERWVKRPKKAQQLYWRLHKDD